MIFVDFKDECLKRLDNKGLSKNKKYKDRLSFELDVVSSQADDYKENIYDYFMKLSKSGKKIANSNKMLISYLLDISDEDPVATNQPLIKTKAAEYPDIDTDFEDVQRDHIKEYLIQKYGQEHVASICAIHKMHPKTVIKDVSRIRNIPFEEVNEITADIPDTFEIGDKDVPASLPLVYERMPKVKAFFDKYSQIDLYRLCEKLEGNVRHMGMHAAGVVISPKDKPLNELVGLEKAKDTLITCWQEGDSREMSLVGLIKFDILGLNTLSVLKSTLNMIKTNRGIDLDLDSIPLDDKKVLNGFYTGDTIGVFQFEKGWIRSLLKKIKITSFEDISAVNALNRPGPLDAKMDEKFWKIKNGLEKQSYLHPLLEPILKNTYCIILYQEQIMEIAQKLAGFTADEADAFRSALSKGKADLSKGINPFIKHEKKFIEACMRNGVKGKIRIEKNIYYDPEIPVTAENIKQLSEGEDSLGHYKRIACDVEIADELFSQIKTFARYGFNKSHSVEYGYIAYQCMYLKTYYPKEFMASILTNTPNKVEKKKNTEENKFVDYFFEAKRMGIKVLPPDINESQRGFSVVDESIRSGFGFIKGLGDKAVAEILQKRPFSTFKDFLMKVDGRSINKSAVLALIHSGCFDSFLNIGNDRKKLSKRYELVTEYVNFKKDKKLSDLIDFAPTAIKAVFKEAEVCGAELFNNILHLVDKAEINKMFNADDQIIKFTSIDKINVGTTIRIVGVVDSIKIVNREDGRDFAFVNIKNGNNRIKLMMWNDQLKKLQADPEFYMILSPNSVVTARIQRQKDYDNRKTFVLKADGIKKLL
jgi:DNA polymerase-3 subunit alpha